MEVSLFLAKLFGLLMLIKGIALFLRADEISGIVKSLKKSKALEFFVSMTAVVVGLLLVLIHNEWATGWQSLISLVGWLILMKGVLFLWSPDMMYEFVEQLDSPFAYRVASMVLYILAIYLLAYGFGYAF